MTRARRAISPPDRRRILGYLRGIGARDLVGLRTRALVMLAWCSGLRLNECLQLNTAQILEAPASGKMRIVSTGYLRPGQAKGRRKGHHQWVSAGAFALPKPARVAILAYLRECRRRGWMQWPPPANAPLFLAGGRSPASRKKDGRPVRLAKRTAQHFWEQAQQRALVPEPYVFHELRHDAMTRFGAQAGGDVFKVAAFGRCSVRTALRYVHTNVQVLGELAERAAS